MFSTHLENIFIKFEICHLQTLLVWKSLKFVVWESVNFFTKWQNCRPIQIQSICRWQNKWDTKTEIWSGKGRKNCGKRRKCWLPAFSPFPTVFSKGYCLRVIKSRDCVVKSQTPFFQNVANLLWTVLKGIHISLPNSKIVDFQIETNCRRHFKMHLKRKISAIHGKKHCDKRRNCLSQCFPQLYILMPQNAPLCGIVWNMNSYQMTRFKPCPILKHLQMKTWMVLKKLNFYLGCFQRKA